MTSPRVLIAGIGNIFLGDDAFGVEVVRRLQERALPDGVRAVDFGIRGFDLALALIEPDLDKAILVDATPRGHSPGTLYVIEPERPSAGKPSSPAAVEGHNLDPVKVLSLAATFGQLPRKILLVGCEPEQINGDDLPMSMSPAAMSAVDEAVRLVESLVVSGGVLPV